MQDLLTAGGNIGSEISRAIRWKNKQNEERMGKAVDRALELMDLSIRWAQREESRKTNPGAVREFCRMREIICDYFLAENEFMSSDKSMAQYFDQFALARKTDQKL